MRTVAKVRISGPKAQLDLELLVDTGSAYTWVQRKSLEKIGIAPFAKRSFRTIEGKLVEREIGEAVIECLGERATRIIVFAEEADIEVLGLDALEGLGLEVDPVTGKLRRSEALLAVPAVNLSIFARSDSRRIDGRERRKGER